MLPCLGVFIELRDIRVIPISVIASHDFDGANQLFFRHDFVLAAIAADFDRGGRYRRECDF
jgi:hypothetical protein